MSVEQVDYIEAMGSAEGRRSLLIFRLNTAGIGSEDERAVRELLAEVAALKAEIARLSAPVSNSEFIRGCDQGRPTNGKVIFDRIILARATPPHGDKQ